MDNSGFVVGIELGTSKIVGILGRKNEQGVITILASETVPSDSAIKYGVIYNIDEAAGKIKKLISLLENKTGKKIGRTYVSVAGRSLNVTEHIETKTFGKKELITIDLLDKLEQQAKQYKPEFHTNYGVSSPRYFLDGEPTENPIGKEAYEVEVRYMLVIGRPGIKNSLLKAISEKCRIEIAGYATGPISSGALLLDEPERMAGCALVDFGAGTTSITIYKDGLLRFISVIPFGGRTITKDIQGLGLVYDVAENCKVRYGKLGRDKTKQNISSAGTDIDLKELNKVIQLRTDEIIMNVLHQIKESGYGDQLDAGIVLTGGASQLSGLTEYLEEKLQMPVKKSAAKRIYINNAADLIQNPAYSQVVGMLLSVNGNCEKAEQQEVDAVGGTGDYEESEEELKVRKKEEKKRKKEEERKRREEEKKNGGQQKTIWGFFEKIQNFGGTIFDEESDEEEDDDNENKKEE